MKKLLLTGFGPFAENIHNPTQAIINDLDNSIINNFQIIGKILSVSYKRASEEISSLIEAFDPEVVLSLGLAADRTKITPELIAINYQHSEIADNDGVIKKFSKIDKKSKESFYSTLNVEKLLNNLKQTSIASELSSSAGTYVCNTVMYQALRKISQEKRQTISGFIHVPPNINHKDLLMALTTCINSI